LEYPNCRTISGEGNELLISHRVREKATAKAGSHLDATESLGFAEGKAKGRGSRCGEKTAVAGKTHRGGALSAEEERSCDRELVRKRGRGIDG